MSEAITTPELKMPISTADDINDIFKSIDSEEKVEKSEDKSDKSSKSKDDILEDDDEDVSPKEKKSKKSDDSEDDEDSDDDIEFKEPDDEDEEKLNLKEEEDAEFEIDAPPRKKDLLKDYPDIFKKHPFLEKMMYRDRQMMELFGSFDNAKEIAERSELFENFDKQLMSGKTEDILKGVKENDSKAFDKIVDDYLPALARVDKDAYFEVVGNIGKRLIMDMVKKSKELDNPALKEAALIINQFLFDSNEFVPAKPRSESAKNDEKSEVETERATYLRERFTESVDDLQSKVDNVLTATINEYIDPRSSMTSYVKKNAVKDAMSYLQTAIASDSSVKKTLDKLWKNAADAKFSKDSLGRIKSFYLSRAKGNMKAAILKARSEALKDAQPRTKREKEKDDDNETSKSSNRGRVIPGKPSSQNKDSNKMQKGESVVDFLSRD